MIALLLAMTPPAPSIPSETAYPLPEYRANCRLVDRDGKRTNARVDVSGVGDTRKLQVTLKSGQFPELRDAVIYPGPSIRVVGNKKWASVMDAKEFNSGNDAKTIWIEVGSDLSKGAELKLTQRSEVVPLLIGLCSTKPLAKKS